MLWLHMLYRYYINVVIYIHLTKYILVIHRNKMLNFKIFWYALRAVTRGECGVNGVWLCNFKTAAYL